MTFCVHFSASQYKIDINCILNMRCDISLKKNEKVTFKKTKQIAMRALRFDCLYILMGTHVLGFVCFL